MGLSMVFKALGDDTRREILRLLARGDMTAGEISRAFDLSRPTISHHLNILKEAGLVVDEKRGHYVIYSLNTTVFQDVTGWLFEMISSLTRRDRHNGREELRSGK
ncbi:MAG: autorepressor SdpR family transcription factor [Desulfofundulus sp.]|uniref:autorepressor SdpR family transcription factor n=1 Tax=Desulfofundulus sp. TaxID=2282750 RepID=UPI003C74F0C3